MRSCNRTHRYLWCCDKTNTAVVRKSLEVKEHDSVNVVVAGFAITRRATVCLTTKQQRQAVVRVMEQTVGDSHVYIAILDVSAERRSQR